MVAKLALGLVAVVFIVSVATVAAFWYFNQQSERRYKKDIRQMEQTEKIFEAEGLDDPIDRELEQEKDRRS